MLADVRVGPAVEAAGANRGDEVRHQVVAELIALVDRGPQRIRARHIRKTHRVAQAARIETMSGTVRVVLVDGGTLHLAWCMPRRRVGGGSDRDVQLRA